MRKAIAAFAVLWPCATQAQTIDDMELRYAGSVGVLVAYEQLPECLYTDAQPCKDSVLAKQLDAAQLSASQALQKAIQSHDAAALNDARQSLDLFGSLLNPKDN